MKYINLILTICLTISMVSCSNDDNIIENTDLIGTWKITEIYNYNETELLPLRNCQEKETLTLNSNSSGVFVRETINSTNCETENLNISWTEKKELLNILMKKEELYSFKIILSNKNVLKLKLLVDNNEDVNLKDQVIMVYKK